MFGEKSQISIVELVIVVTALIVVLGTFFQPFVYRTRWREAQILLFSRDLLLTLERINKLYDFSFDSKALSSFLDSKFNISEKNLIVWKEIRGTVPETVIVACNCTKEEIDKMNFWFNPLKINNRTIHFVFLQSNLEDVPMEADVLLIRGYKSLANFKSKFMEYLRREMGIVEMMNFVLESQIDEVQRDIFGLEWIDSPITVSYMHFSQPSTAKDLVYLPYKYFYHVPLPINITYSDSGWVAPGCNGPMPNGTFFFNRANYFFWICNKTHVIFDANGDGSGDIYVMVKKDFDIAGQKFKLNYINVNDSIALSFSSEYSFLYDVTIPRLRAKDDGEKVFLKAFYASEEYPAVILNYSRVAWMYDFGNNPSHEEKQLLASLLFWASRKKQITLKLPIKTGFSSSYLNIKNDDIFEVYEITLGLASPY